MMRTVAASICLAAIVANGCGQRAPALPVVDSPATNQDAGVVVEQPDVGAVLKELTQALRRYSAEKREVPASLDALVAAGYLQAIPQAPGGKTFAIDARKVQVIVK